jgi:hypothetical protein
VTISFDGDIHFVFVRVAIAFSFLAAWNFHLPQAAPMRLWSVWLIHNLAGFANNFHATIQ